MSENHCITVFARVAEITTLQGSNNIQNYILFIVARVTIFASGGDRPRCLPRQCSVGLHLAQGVDLPAGLGAQRAD